MIDTKRHTSGLRLLQNILEEKDWEILSKNNISDSEFHGDAKKALKFIRDYYSEYNDFPPKDVVEDNKDLFPNKTEKDGKVKGGFPSKTPLDYSLKKFKDYQLSKELTDLLTDSRDYIVKGDPQSALGVLVSGVNSIKPTTQLLSFKDSALKFYEEYVANKNKPLQGILPPWPTLANAILMYENGTLNSILGTTSVGKTWCSSVAAMFAAFTQGKLVLYVSMENNENSIDSRMRAYYHKIPFGDLRAGLVDLQLQKRWNTEIPLVCKEEGNVIIVDDTKVRTVSDIHSLISVYQPDFVVVDGAYKLEGEGKAQYEKSRSILNGLHKLANASKDPFLATSQLNPDANKAVGASATAYNARGDKGWHIDVSSCMVITQTPDQQLLNQVFCQIAKGRELGDVTGIPMDFIMVQDRKRMEFYELDEYTNQDIVDMTL